MNNTAKKAESVQPNMQNIMRGLMNKLFVPCGNCPICDSTIYKPKAKRPDGSEIQVSACPMCGWKSYSKNSITEEQQRRQWTIEAKKNTAKDYLRANSIFESQEQLHKTFNNFRIDDSQHEALKNNAKKLVQEFIVHEPTHTVLNGGVGRGKSHLAMAMIYEYLEQTHYQKNATFVNWPGLLSNTKKAMGNNMDDIKIYVNNVVGELNKSDLIVIDDLGAESASNKPKEYSVDMATSIFSSRSEKNLIVTTNLSAKEIKAAYGDRLVSRMLNHLNLGGMNFSGIEDFRMKKIG